MLDPEDDPLWPECAGPPEVSAAPSNRASAYYDRCNRLSGGKHWCDWTANFIRSARDTVSNGTRICVPIVPTHGLYASMSIGVDELAPSTYALAIVMPEAVFSQFEEIVDLGFCSVGECRMSFCYSAIDWAVGKATGECNAFGHGLKEQADWNASSGLSDTRNVWCMAYHGMCFSCYTKPINTAGYANGFGLDPSSFTGFSPYGTKGNRGSNFNDNNRVTGREARTRAALQQRFGNGN